MILDASTSFSIAQAITTGTQLSSNPYDAGVPRDVGVGDAIRIRATVNAAFGGGSSLQVNIVEDSQASLATATVLLSSPPIAEASLTAGAVILDAVLPKTKKRFIGLQYVSVGTHTSGTVDAGVQLDADSNAKFLGNIGY